MWDFAGQETYRNEYLADPESYLSSISYAFYVVDVQDYYRIFFSVMYFNTVIPIIKKHSPDAEIIILFNKTDPKFDPSKKNIKKIFLDKVDSFIKGHQKPIVTFDTTIFDLNSIKTAFNGVI